MLKRILIHFLAEPVWIPQTYKNGTFEGGEDMTDAQKKLIRSMRMDGIGYKAIANSLGLNVDQVHLYCRMNGLAGDGTLVKANYSIWCKQNNRCPVCGEKLRQPKNGRSKKYCSGRCRTRAFRDKCN